VLQLKQLAKIILNVVTVEELRGYEGMAAAIYFAQLGSYFPENVPFTARNRRPPKDAANAILSWTYAIVQGEIDSMIRSHGLDSCIGFLHAVSHGTPALALDLLEPLRAPCCDMTVLNILNHRHLTEEDFEYHDQDGGTYMKATARTEFFQTYEMAMTRKFTPYGGDSHVDFRTVIRESVFNILKTMEDNYDFEFFLMP
jgi:CRISPR-associated protein Cas1